MPATPQRAPKLLQLGAEDYSNYGTASPTEGKMGFMKPYTLYKTSSQPRRAQTGSAGEVLESVSNALSALDRYLVNKLSSYDLLRSTHPLKAKTLVRS